MHIGFLGLGKMGKRMVEKLVLEGHAVVAWNRNFTVGEDLREELRSKNYALRIEKEIKDIFSSSESPHVFWLMLPAGEVTESVLQELKKFIKKGDVVIDGANSFYEDTQRRSEEFALAGIEFLGIGVSGGILAPDNGFPLMVGGSETGYEKVKPLLDSLAKPRGGHAYFGKGGAGHYIKMIHNGIEYGMMQAIGEGFGVLDKGPYKIDLEKVADLWNKNTIISSFLIDRAKDALKKDAHLDATVGFIEENGEAKWTIALAKKLQVPIHVTEDSLKFRQESQKNPEIQKTFAAKMVAALRHEFGGHKVKEK